MHLQAPSLTPDVSRLILLASMVCLLVVLPLSCPPAFICSYLAASSSRRNRIRLRYPIFCTPISSSSISSVMGIELYICSSIQSSSSYPAFRNSGYCDLSLSRSNHSRRDGIRFCYTPPISTKGIGFDSREDFGVCRALL